MQIFQFVESSCCPIIPLMYPLSPFTPSSIMNFFLETIQVLLLSIWYNVESFIHLFVPMKKKNIAGEVVLITGAGSGIGRLMAQEFAALGTVLVLWDINQEGVKETARLAKQSGASRVHYYLCDCSNKNEVYGVADQVRFFENQKNSVPTLRFNTIVFDQIPHLACYS